MTEEKFEEFLQQAAQDYNRPPETPRAEMWARIDAVRAKRRGERDLERAARPWVLWAAGIAAVLLLGIGIGRMTAPGQPGDEPAPVASTTEDPADEGAVMFQVAAAEYLETTDAFLSLFQTEARAGRADAQVAAWADDLLTTARLMLDSPVARDPNFRELLEDLELILVQISQYATYQSTEELELIEQGLDERNVQLRLQAALATGDELMGQGAL
jgi:hypothetical protein